MSFIARIRRELQGLRSAIDQLEDVLSPLECAEREHGVRVFPMPLSARALMSIHEARNQVECGGEILASAFDPHRVPKTCS
jgi:hypothetical protein